MSRYLSCCASGLCSQRLSAHPLLYADEKFDGVLFETSSSEKNGKASVLGRMREVAQAAFALLLGECLHAT